MRLELTSDEKTLEEVFERFFSRECPEQVVRDAEDAEPVGFDKALWRKLTATGAHSMALTESAGGGGAGLTETGLVAQKLGQFLAPVPLIEHITASRLLVAAGADPSLCEPLATGEKMATLALKHDPKKETAPLCAAGAVADMVVCFADDSLLVSQDNPPLRAAPNFSGLPIADRGLKGAIKIKADAHLHERAIGEYKALMSMAFVGLGQGAISLALDYVRERKQFDVPIGSFQAIQHALADSATALEGAYFLAQKALWALDSQADAPQANLRAAAAFLFCAETAQMVSAKALQCHGGYGYAEEYAIQLYYRRAKGWQMLCGSAMPEYQKIADGLFDAANPDSLLSKISS